MHVCGAASRISLSRVGGMTIMSIPRLLAGPGLLGGIAEYFHKLTYTFGGSDILDCEFFPLFPELPLSSFKSPRSNTLHEIFIPHGT
jgi:hypothetical protein